MGLVVIACHMHEHTPQHISPSTSQHPHTNPYTAGPDPLLRHHPQQPRPLPEARGRRPVGGAAQSVVGRQRPRAPVGAGSGTCVCYCGTYKCVYDGLAVVVHIDLEMQPSKKKTAHFIQPSMHPLPRTCIPLIAGIRVRRELVVGPAAAPLPRACPAEVSVCFLAVVASDCCCCSVLLLFFILVHSGSKHNADWRPSFSN